MRAALGDGYTEALRDAHKKVPESCDFVMYWWDHAARLVAEKKAKRFGFITTNSITQTFNRKIVSGYLDAKKPLSLAFAVPDHPWVDSSDGAAVRVGMSVGVLGSQLGMLLVIESETDVEGEDASEVSFTQHTGRIFADLSTGANVAGAVQLLANSELASQGVTPLGLGFRIDEEQIIKCGYSPNDLPPVIKRYCIGRDIVQRWEEKYIIDFYGLTEGEARTQYPALMQIVQDLVKPERMEKKRDSYRANWWIYAEPRAMLRRALVNVDQYVATCRTAKHRPFVMLDKTVLPDAKVVAIALNDFYHLGVLSSKIHETWAIATGAWMGVGNDSNYNHSECFVKFPFPAATEAQQATIRSLGEQLDAHRKRQQAQHPELTMTGMYNVLERVRGFTTEAQRHGEEQGKGGKEGAGAPLNAKEKLIYEQGLVGILRQLHDELDAAVADVYGWSDLRHSGLDPEPRLSSDPSQGHPEPRLSSDPSPAGTGSQITDEILTRLVALNAARAAEEAQGHIRWLRPEYQAPNEQPAAKQGKLIEEEEEIAAAPAELLPWPKELPQQAAAVREVLRTLQGPAAVDAIAAHFAGKKTPKRVKEIGELVETLRALGVG